MNKNDKYVSEIDIYIKELAMKFAKEIAKEIDIEYRYFRFKKTLLDKEKFNIMLKKSILEQSITTKTIEKRKNKI